MITVEPMRWWHISRVHELEEELFPVDSWSTEQFWQELGLDTRRYFVATYEGEIIGYAGAFVLPPDSDVQTIAVGVQGQGSGVGGRLLDELMHCARTAGCTHMMLEVRADNEAAIALYSRRGFSVISTRRHYYSDATDALIMRSDLRVAVAPGASS